MPLIIPKTQVQQGDFIPVAGKQRSAVNISNPVAGIANEIQGIANFMAKEQDEQDRTTANDAFNTLKQANNENYNTEGDGYFTQSGNNAVNGYGDAVARLEEVNQSLFESLTPRQQKYYKLSSDKLMIMSLADMQAHKTREIEVAKIASLKGSIAVANQTVVNNYGEESLGEQIASVTNSTNDLANMSGVDSEARLAELNKQKGKIYFSAAQAAFADKQFNRVNEIIRAHGDYLTPGQKMSLQAGVKSATKVVNADASKHLAYNAVEDAYFPGSSVSENTELARRYAEESTGRNLSTEEKIQIDKAIKNKMAINKRSKIDLHEKQYAKLAKYLADGGDFNTLSEEELSGISTAERNSLMNINNSGSDNNDFLISIHKLTPEEVKNIDLVKFRQYFKNVNSEGIEKGMALLEQMRKGNFSKESQVYSASKSLFKTFPLTENEDPESPSWFSSDEKGVDIKGLIKSKDRLDKDTLKRIRVKRILIANLILAKLIEEKRSNDESIQFTQDEYLNMWLEAGYTNKYNFGYKDIPVEEIPKLLEIIKSKNGDITDKGLILDVYINQLGIEEDED